VVVASLTSFVGDHSVYAIFLLMAVAAVVPAASELVMIYAGALASGAVSGAHVVLFGHTIESTGWAYVTVALTGTLGNTLGAVCGWAIGRYGGRPLLERHGRWLHVTPRRIEGAEAWFDRWDRLAVPMGFALPVVRSFVAIPAGFLREPLGRFVPEAALGCAVFCFGLAAGGWALGSSYNSLHDALTYVGVALVAIAAVGAVFLWYRKRSSTISGRAEDSAR
jgi:membrane protein DedA with SNARE-associated domain